MYEKYSHNVLLMHKKFNIFSNYLIFQKNCRIVNKAYYYLHAGYVSLNCIVLLKFNSKYNQFQPLTFDWRMTHTICYHLFPRSITIFNNIFVCFSFSAFQVIQDIFGSILMVLVTIGYKTKLSALILVLLLTALNLYYNAWWSIPAHKPLRDFLKYDFFQVSLHSFFISRKSINQII